MGFYQRSFDTRTPVRRGRLCRVRRTARARSALLPVVWSAPRAGAARGRGSDHRPGIPIARGRRGCGPGAQGGAARSDPFAGAAAFLASLSPRAAAIAVMATLAFGVVVGSGANSLASSSSPLLVALSPTATPPSPAVSSPSPAPTSAPASSGSPSTAAPAAAGPPPTVTETVAAQTVTAPSSGSGGGGGGGRLDPALDDEFGAAAGQARVRRDAVWPGLQPIVRPAVGSPIPGAYAAPPGRAVPGLLRCRSEPARERDRADQRSGADRPNAGQLSAVHGHQAGQGGLHGAGARPRLRLPRHHPDPAGRADHRRPYLEGVRGRDRSAGLREAPRPAAARPSMAPTPIRRRSRAIRT